MLVDNSKELQLKETSSILLVMSPSPYDIVTIMFNHSNYSCLTIKYVDVKHQIIQSKLDL